MSRATDIFQCSFEPGDNCFPFGQQKMNSESDFFQLQSCHLLNGAHSPECPTNPMQSNSGADDGNECQMELISTERTPAVKPKRKGSPVIEQSDSTTDPGEDYNDNGYFGKSTAKESKAPPRKRRITEEKMAAELRNMHITFSADRHPDSDGWFFMQRPETFEDIEARLSDSDDEEDRNSANSPSNDPKVLLDASLQKYLASKNAFNPLITVPSNSMAVVLWKPPESDIEKILHSAHLPSSSSSENYSQPLGKSDSKQTSCEMEEMEL